VSAYLAAATPEIDADTLACKIMWKDLPFGGNPDNYIRLDANAAHAVIELLRPHLAALPAPRTITTVEELEASPAETVIKAADGNVYEQNTLDPRLSAQWVATGSKYPVVPECVELPATVLWVPTEGGGE